MAMKYQRTELAENIGYTSVIDSKFKTNSLVIRFITRLNKENAGENAAGIGMITSANSQFKTCIEFNKKLSSLYGAYLSSSVNKRGDLQILSINVSWLDNRFAFDGEDITAEILDFICCCLFSPDAENDKFSEDVFEIIKKDIIDQIDTEINDKRRYALIRAAGIAFRNEPAENTSYGVIENAKSITSESAYKAYRNFLENAQIEITCVSSAELPEVENHLKNSFTALNNNHRQTCVFRSPSPAKKEIERVSEEFNVNQSKMVMTFKTSSDDKYALKIMSMIFGETPVSKLFMNVREKMSLCYYCASRTNFSKGALTVDSGVEKHNIDKAENEILHQLDEIKNGCFSDEEINNAMAALSNALSSIGDTASSYSSWYFERFCDGEFLTPQQQLQEYQKVNRERIIQAAKSLTLDSVYLMLSKEAQE